MSASSAANVIKQFRVREINALRSHLLSYGPLPPATGVIPLNANLSLPNPFLPFKGPSGRWIPSKYSLRRQSELVKHAREAGLLHLLPPGPKNPSSQLKEELTKAGVKFTIGENLEEDDALLSEEEPSSVAEIREEDRFWQAPIAWHGDFKEKSVPGAELGTRLYAGKARMFKGHKWERVKESREKRQTILLRDMDARIERYKSWYKNKRPNPLKPPRSAKAPKLPF